MAAKNTKETKEIKVDKWDGNGLKNALVDAVRNVFLDDLKYSEKNTYVDTRLLLSTLGCGVALYALVYDYLFPFPLSKIILIICVLSYFVLMSILTFFMTFIEKNIVLLASQKESAGLDPDSVWTIETAMKRFENNFTITLTKVDGVTKKSSYASLQRCVSTWVDEEGRINLDKLKNDIMSCHKNMLSGGKKDQ